jgi:hypothetical protein
MPILLAFLGAAALGGAALATGGHPGAAPATGAPRSAEAAARYPQPVRVADLAGRQLLEDRPNQRGLGRIDAVIAGPNGQPSLLVRRTRWWGGDAGLVAVPVTQVALLGQFVVLKDMDAAGLAALPALRAPAPAPLAAAEVIRVGLARN